MPKGIAAALTLCLAAGCSAQRSSPVNATANVDDRVTEVAGAPAETGEAVGWSAPIPELPYNEREGRTLFRYYCAPCHGEEGHGDGFNAYNLDPRPRDLADPRFQAERSDDELTAVIRSGGGASGLSAGMPPWGRTLNERQIVDLVRYLRTLEKPEGKNES